MENNLVQCGVIVFGLGESILDRKYWVDQALKEGFKTNCDGNTAAHEGPEYVALYRDATKK